MKFRCAECRLYDKGRPVTTPAERRAALLGFVYGPFRVKDFLHGILGADQGGIDLELFDGATPSPTTLLLHNRPEATLDARRPTASGERSALVQVPAGQHLWTLSLHTLPGYLSGADASQPLIVAVGGLVIDTFLFIIIVSISRQQRADERLSRQLREQLDDSEARYSALFKSARAVMLLIDPETGDILDANPAAERFYGYDQLRRMQIHDINPLPPDELQREMRRARQEQQEVFLFSHRLANGELRRVEVHSGPFRYGGRSALYSIIHDVTERERIAAALQASERRYAEVLAITGEGIWDWDILANRVTHNRRWLEILGSENLAGPHPVEEFADCLHEDDRAAVLAAIQEALAGRAPYVHQHRMRRADGYLIWVLDRGQVVERDADGAPRRMLGSLVDVTERMEHELVLKTERQRAEAANVAKSRFLATMSHEIRTPMNGVLGMAQLLLMPQLAESDRLDYARIILDSGQTLLALLNDILDFSKIEAGKVRLDLVAFRPNDLLQEIQTLFSAAARSQALALQQDWRGPGDQGYRADSHRLRQMLSNLVGNAIKFTHKGGIRIEASEIARDDRTALLEFAVSDTGIGIAEQQQALLFQPFSQVDSAATRHYDGSGLGLSIVRSLARLMNGEVGVDSQAGTGSRFWFRIRADLVAKTEAPRGVDPSPAARPARFSAQVLVVEDDPVNRQIMQSLLNRLGVTVTLAEDGQQGLVAATTRETGTPDTAPDLVLMDCQMPVLDGYAATARIRHWEQENAQPHLPIIALTANVFDDDRRRCLNAGMDDFLGKPALLDDLVALLDRWLPATEASATTAARPDGVDQPADLARVTGLLAELRPLLEQHKFDALACCKDLEDAVAGTRLAAVVNGIGAPLASFRFDLALEQLRRLAEAEGWEC